MRRNRAVRAVKILVIAVAALGVLGFVLSNLWNWLMPAIFGLHPIGFWQALGLFLLSKLLFGGIHGQSGQRHWRHRMMERWERMSPEERERFRAGMEGGWRGFEPQAPEPKE